MFVAILGERLSDCWMSPVQGAEDCMQCRHFQDGAVCVEHCPSGVKEDHQTIWKYSNATGHCLPCNTNCTLS